MNNILTYHSKIKFGISCWVFLKIHSTPRNKIEIKFSLYVEVSSLQIIKGSVICKSGHD